jgi:hypothetical protein
VRNFSTLFLIVALVTGPLHLAHAYVFREVIALSELHPAIERFPPTRKVRGIGRSELSRARIAYFVINAVELALLPLMVRAAARALAVDRQQGVPTALGAWATSLRSSAPRARLGGVSVRALGAAALGAFIIGWLAREVGLLVIEPLPDPEAWAGVGLVEALCRACGAPFFLGVAASGAGEDT